MNEDRTIAVESQFIYGMRNEGIYSALLLMELKHFGQGMVF